MSWRSRASPSSVCRGERCSDTWLKYHYRSGFSSSVSDRRAVGQTILRSVAPSLLSCLMRYFNCYAPHCTAISLHVARHITGPPLCASQKFCSAVYKASDRKSILTAMNSFLDESIVLPPGDFDKNTLFPITLAKKRLEAQKEAGSLTNAGRKSGKRPTAC